MGRSGGPRDCGCALLSRLECGAGRIRSTHAPAVRLRVRLAPLLCVLTCHTSAHAVLCVTAGAANNAAQILAILKTEPELFAEVWAVSFRAKRRWDVHLKNGIDVRLPETDPISAWSRLAILDRVKQITNRDLAVIDLRLPHQLVVEPNIPIRGRGRRT